MIFTSFSNYYNDENTYILCDSDKKNAVVIDPGCDIDILNEFFLKNEINLSYILLTHCHYDHICDLPELRKNKDVKLICGKNCDENLKNTNINLTESGLGYKLTENADIILEDNQIFNADGLSFKCIYTPGHTDCSVCYLFENKLFSGDTLFLRSVGRWDLPTGDENTLKASLRERIYTLDEETEVYPGHGNKTIIGYEKKYNMFIKMKD